MIRGVLNGASVRGAKGALGGARWLPLAFGICLALSGFSLAATPAGGLQSAPMGLETLRENLLRQAKNRTATQVGDAFAALRAEKWKQAREKGAALIKSREYSDYGYWVTAVAELRESEELLKDKPAEAGKLAEKAANNFRQIEARSPYSPLNKLLAREIAWSEIVSAQVRVRQQKFEEALDFFERGFQRFNGGAELGELPAEAFTQFGMACLKTNSARCYAWAQRIASVSVRGSAEAKAIVKAFPEVADRPRVPSVERRTRSYKAPDLDVTAFDAAMMLYFAGEMDRAIEAFQRYLDEFPRSVFRFRARFWLGQALKTKEAIRAKVVFTNLQADSPLTWYGLLASLETGQAIEKAISASVPVGQQRDPLLLPWELFRLQRAEELVRAAAYDAAALELRDLRARDAHSSPFLSYLLMLNSMAGNHVGAFSMASELIQRGYEHIASTTVLRMLFPLAYLEEIQKVARTYELDPILLLSLVKQESSFAEDALSSAGAMGLTQLMPATAFDTQPQVSRRDLRKREHNLAVGGAYLRQLLNRFNGNIALALAGYNAGPNAVDRWVKQYSANKPMIDFIEQIPYRETREYVPSIIRNYYWYSKRMGLPEKPLSYFWGGKP